jgi:hypothetical protein
MPGDFTMFSHPIIDGLSKNASKPVDAAEDTAGHSIDGLEAVQSKKETD